MILSFSGRISKDGFQFQKFLEPGFAPFPTVSRLFVTPEAAAKMEAGRVAAHVARSDSFGDAAGVLEITRCHIAGESVGRVVGNVNGIVFIFVRDDAKNRAAGQDTAEDPRRSLQLITTVLTLSGR